MIKSMCKKLLIITLIMIIFLMIISSDSNCFALGDVTNGIGWEHWEPAVEDGDEILDKSNIIIGIVRVIGIMISVGSLILIGIKFIFGSVEEKANYKQKLVPWLIGATMVFAITTIPSIIYDFTQGTVSENEEIYFDGYNAAMSRASTRTSLPSETEGYSRGENYGRGWEAAIKKLKEIYSASRKGYAEKWTTMDQFITNGDITKSNWKENFEQRLVPFCDTSRYKGGLYLSKMYMYKGGIDRLKLEMEEWGVSCVDDYSSKGYEAAMAYVAAYGKISSADFNKWEAFYREINDSFGEGYGHAVDRMQNLPEECSVQEYAKNYKDMIFRDASEVYLSTLDDIVETQDLNKFGKIDKLCRNGLESLTFSERVAKTIQKLGYDFAMEYITKRNEIPSREEMLTNLLGVTEKNFQSGYFNAITKINGDAIEFSGSDVEVKGYKIQYATGYTNILNKRTIEDYIVEYGEYLAYKNAIKVSGNLDELQKDERCYYSGAIDSIVKRIEKMALADTEKGWNVYRVGYKRTLVKMIDGEILQEHLNGEISNINTYESAYWAGQIDAVKDAFENQGNNYLDYVRGYLDSHFNDVDLDVELENAYKTIEGYEGKEKDATYYSTMGKIKKMEIEKHILNGDEYIADSSK